MAALETSTDASPTSTLPTVPTVPRVVSAADDRLTAMGLFVETYAAVHARTVGHLAQFGLAPAEFEVCIRLARSPECRLRMGDLAAQATITPSGATRVVDRLVERGVVRRVDCPTDRRATYAALTEQGARLMTELLPGHLALIDQWVIAPLRAGDVQSGRDRLADFTAALRCVRDHVAPCSMVGTQLAD